MKMTRLPYDYSRCADGADCPLSDECARWLTRASDTENRPVPYTPFFTSNGPGNCLMFIDAKEWAR